MYMLAFESSAKAASAALAHDGRLVSQYFQSSGLTHSRTLLPMALDMLKSCELTVSDIDAVAVSQGPGSFTGVRIGVSTVKGLCWGADKPAVGVSTLEAMAWNGECAAPGSIICCAMDARRNQVYNALFEFEDGRPRRLCPDRALSLEELSDELGQYGRTVFVVGDGAGLCHKHLTERNIDALLAPEAVRLQTAWGVCRAAEGKPLLGADKLLPVYLRLSQAERERQEKMNKIIKDKGEISMSTVYVFDHPLIQHKLSILRDEATGVKEFRELVSEIAMLMCYEATRDLPLEDVEIQTPVSKAVVKRISGKKLAVVPILRAGLGMVDGMLALLPSAKVGHIGLYRDPETLEPVEYYCKMPNDITEREVIVVDPMLATGGSAVAACSFLKNKYGCRHVKLMCIIAAPEGIAAMQEAHPDIDIFVAAEDEKLNEHGYIVPGLGDAGDRIFGTK